VKTLTKTFINANYEITGKYVTDGHLTAHWTMKLCKTVEKIF